MFVNYRSTQYTLILSVKIMFGHFRVYNAMPCQYRKQILNHTIIAVKIQIPINTKIIVF